MAETLGFKISKLKLREHNFSWRLQWLLVPRLQTKHSFLNVTAKQGKFQCDQVLLLYGNFGPKAYSNFAFMGNYLKGSH